MYTNKLLFYKGNWYKFLSLSCIIYTFLVLRVVCNSHVRYILSLNCYYISVNKFYNSSHINSKIKRFNKNDFESNFIIIINLRWILMRVLQLFSMHILIFLLHYLHHIYHNFSAYV